jgi:type 1 fimbriae regulatory protein FimB/type 1 fimbriae regulatory protein FimE
MSNFAVAEATAEPALTTELDTGSTSGDRAKPRQWLTENEVEAIMSHAAGPRDKLMILMAYRHGLRVSELVNLTWPQIDLEAGRFAVRRLKRGEDSVHPLAGRELRGLRKLRRRHPVARYVFLTDRGTPMTRNGFFKLLQKAATKAGLADVHPHLLRHATGFKLVNQGFDTLSLAAYLGHRQVANTKRYCRMDSRRFEGLWRD